MNELNFWPTFVNCYLNVGFIRNFCGVIKIKRGEIGERDGEIKTLMAWLLIFLSFNFY